MIPQPTVIGRNIRVKGPVMADIRVTILSRRNLERRMGQSHFSSGFPDPFIITTISMIMIISNDSQMVYIKLIIFS